MTGVALGVDYFATAAVIARADQLLAFHVNRSDQAPRAPQWPAASTQITSAKLGSTLATGTA